MELKVLAGVFLLSLFIGTWAFILWECRNAPIVEDDEEETPLSPFRGGENHSKERGGVTAPEDKDKG